MAVTSQTFIINSEADMTAFNTVAAAKGIELGWLPVKEAADLGAIAAAVVAEFGGTCPGPFDLSTEAGRDAMDAAATGTGLKGLIIVPSPVTAQLYGFVVLDGTAVVIKFACIKLKNQVFVYIIDGVGIAGLSGYTPDPTYGTISLVTVD